MNNALEVLGAMRHWWDTTQTTRTPQAAIHAGITFLYNNAYPEYQRMQLESSKIAHLRSLFTVWKAVCARSKDYPWHDPQVDTMRAFPAYIEKMLPDLFVQLIGQNVFLGVRFTEEERARHEQLRKAFTRPAPVKGSQTRPFNQTQYPRTKP